MTRILRSAIMAVLLLSAFSAVSTAEKIVSINPSPGVYDQPSTVSSGATVHVAYIGADNAAGPFVVHYAAVNGAVDFGDLTLTRLTTGFMTIPAVKIDNTGAAGDSYFDARHPKIALQTADRVVIFFQARATAADNVYSLYRAQLVLSGNAVASSSVKLVAGIIPAGDVEDVSFGVAASDNTARVAYSFRPSVTGPFQTYYARIGLDNASVVRSPILLSSKAGTTGSRPIPNLRLDSANRAHIAWTADGGTPGSLSGIYYAMVKEFTDPFLGIVDNAAIAATGVIGRDRHWGHPQVLVSPTTNSLVYLLATDEPSAGSSGSLAYVNLNPDAALQDNNSVLLAANNAFLLHPPGVAILPSAFDLYRAEAHIDLGGRIHLTGYGNEFSAPVYYAVKTLAANPFFDFLAFPTPVGYGNEAMSHELPGDYSKAAFAFLGGKGVVFWSGTDNTDPAGRPLMVTALPTIPEYVVFSEKGCSGSPGSHGGSMADLFLLSAPLLFLKVRSVLRRGRFAA